MEDDPDIFLFDGDDAKVGMYLPAFHRKIMSAADPAYATMDHIVIGVTTFYETIKGFAVRPGGIDPERIHPLIPLK
jgi:hypothetical protein